MYSVLLVDDEPFAIEGLQLLIDWEKHGFRVHAVCSDGEEAARLIREYPPDLVVTDIRMPVMDGLELIEQTRLAGNGQTKFVVMSGYNDFEYARRALQLGVSYYLSKPIISAEADEVLSELHAVLEANAQKQLVRHTAERYVLQHALSVFIYGEAPNADEKAALGRLANEASASVWMYIHVVTAKGELKNALAAADAAAAALGFIRLAERDPYSFGMVCGLPCSDDNEMNRTVNSLYSRIQHAVTGRIGFTVGQAVHSLYHIADSYGSAMEAKTFLFFESKPKPLYYEEIKDRTLGFDALLWKHADGIVEAVESNDERVETERIYDVFNHFESCFTMPALVYAFMIHVMLQCSSLTKEFGGDPGLLIERCGWIANEMREKPLLEMRASLLAFCLTCGEELADLRSKQTGGTLAKAVEYVRLHYREPLTVKEIAERFFVNPVYLGQAFSKKYGVGILDFIHDLRMEEAKKLLRDSRLTGAAVAELLGYCSYQHFLKQFEKRLGMKPAEYRKEIDPTLN